MQNNIRHIKDGTQFLRIMGSRRQWRDSDGIEHFDIGFWVFLGEDAEFVESTSPTGSRGPKPATASQPHRQEVASPPTDLNDALWQAVKPAFNGILD